MSFVYKSDGEVAIVRVWLFVGCMLLAIGLFLLFIGPEYNVYASGKAGEVELAQADYNSQIIVRQAQAKLDAASLEAQANEIVANSLGGPEGYLRYLYIDMLKNSDGKHISY